MDDNANSHRVTQALLAWSHAHSKGLRAKGGPDGFASLELHSRAKPDGPEANLTLHAKVVDGRPVIGVLLPPDAAAAEQRAHSRRSSSTAAIFDWTGPSLREPDTTCEGCGALGTVGRAVRTDEPGGVLENHRFCATCWPEQSARYRSRWEEEDRLHRENALRSGVTSSRHRGMAFGAATWHDTLDLVREIKREMGSPAPPSRSNLARLADALSDSASEREGSMPVEVEGFLRRYGSKAQGRGA